LPLVPLKILPLASNTLIPLLLPLSEAILEVRVGPSVLANTLSGGRLRMFACCFLHKSEFLKMDDSDLPF